MFFLLNSASLEIGLFKNVLNLCLLIFICNASPVSAEPKEVPLKEVITLQKKLKETKHYTLKFSQEKYNHSRKKSSSRTGSLRITRPVSFRWALETPVKAAQDWIYNGKELYNYHKNLNEAVKFSTAGRRAKEIQSIVNMVLDIEALLKKYTFERALKEDGIITIFLSSDDGAMASVTLKLDQKNNYVSFMKLLFRDKNYQAITFELPNLGPIPASVYLPPKGVKISNSGL